MSTTSLLQTALQNLHVSQQQREQSHTPRPPSSRGDPSSLPSSRGETPPESGGEEDDDEVLVTVGKGTAPGTPVHGRGMVLGQRLSGLSPKGRDPVRERPRFQPWETTETRGDGVEG
jgi:hypothetical protein